MATTDDSVPEKFSQPRTSQACVRCRSLKTRCLPSDQDGTCQRCFNAKRQCEWPETQRRAKKLRGPSRISQVEQKIDVLVSRLADGDTKPPLSYQDITPSVERSNSCLATPDFRPDTGRTGISTPSSHNDDHSNDAAGSPMFSELAKIHDFTTGQRSDALNSHQGMFQSGPAKESPVNNQTIRELLASGEADNLLNEYRTMCICFPFVPVAPSTTARELDATKPMLLLGILTVASWKNRGLQVSLEEIYRQELADRTIIRPRQTLSLLQSILVYLSWYHFFFTPKSRQLLSLVQLAAGIALDLGIHHKASRRFVQTPANIPCGLPKATDTVLCSQREAERTWLGCFYISSSLAGSVQKPNLIPHTEHMTECCRRLKSEREFPSDEFILSLLSIRHLRDQTIEIFGSDAFKDLPVSDQRIVIHLRYLEQQLEECRSQQTDEVYERVLELSSALFQMELHSIGLRAPASLNDSPSHLPNSAHINSLISCLESGKSFLDTLLAFPTSEYHLISSAEWMRMPYVLITLSKLCIPSDNLVKAQWDVKAAQDRVRLDLYLESLCYRMQSLTTYNPPTQPKPDYWLSMKMIMDMTRSWYHGRIRNSNKEVSAKQSSAFRLNMLQSLHQSLGANNPFGNVGSVPPAHTDTSAFGADIMSSIDMSGLGGMPPVEASFQGGVPMDVDFDMEQFLDWGLWTSGDFSPMMFGGSGFGMG